MTIKGKNKLVLVKLFVILVIVNNSVGDTLNSIIPHDMSLAELDVPPFPMILVEDASAYDKRNNLNRFKNLMLNKDNPERVDDEGPRDEQIYYIPRVASGKKRDVFALPGTRVRLGNSNLRHTSSFGFNNRPAP